jgi:Rad3-related DNA helicase
VKLRFKIQRYQTEAVDAVADCFAGQPRFQPQPLGGAGGETGGETGNAEIALSPAKLLANIQAVQRERGLAVSPALAQSPAASMPDTPNLDIEMETGTGKTYVYIKTITPAGRPPQPADGRKPSLPAGPSRLSCGRSARPPSRSTGRTPTSSSPGARG